MEHWHGPWPVESISGFKLMILKQKIYRFPLFANSAVLMLTHCSHQENVVVVAAEMGAFNIIYDTLTFTCHVRLAHTSLSPLTPLNVCITLTVATVGVTTTGYCQEQSWQKGQQKSSCRVRAAALPQV